MERFSDIVDAISQLPPDDQLALVQILKQRLAAEDRREIVSDVAEARGERRVSTRRFRISVRKCNRE